MPPKPTEGPPLTPAAFHILLSLAENEQHGYGIIKTVLERSNGEVNLGPGTLYGNLKRFIDLAWIEELEARPAADLDDERRRYYRLTKHGIRIAELEAERLESLVRHARAARLLPSLSIGTKREVA
jgi:DNA-binding PadR family transcriptional regulator